MTYTPPGQRVAVVVLRNRGFKPTKAELASQEPMIGMIRFDRLGESDGMAYRALSELKLMDERSDIRCLACLRDPELFDWNEDGVIYRGWILEPDPVDQRLQQVVQMWWIRNLEALPAKPEIKAG